MPRICYILCLANSRKLNGRCLAGIELSQGKNGYNIVRETNGLPKWIRPVSDFKEGLDGAINTNLVEKINLLDIFEIEILKNAPEGYQSENVLFKPSSLKVLKEDSINIDYLDKLIFKDTSLFNNSSNRVSKEDLCNLDYSLILIKPEQIHDIHKDSYNKTTMHFSFSGNQYILKITDPKVEQNIENQKNILTSKTTYLTISLGVPWKNPNFEGEDFYAYKLISGIMYDEAKR